MKVTSMASKILLLYLVVLIQILIAITVMQSSKKSEHKFRKYLSCSKLRSRISCGLCQAICFKCCKVGRIKYVCETTVHFATSDDKPCSSNFIKSNV